MTLGEVGTLYGGLHGKTKADFVGGNAKYVTYLNVLVNLAVAIDKCENVVVTENEEQNCVQYGDILFTLSSETAEEVGMTSVVTQTIIEPIYLNSFCLGFRPNNGLQLLPEFAKYLFRSNAMRAQIIRAANGVTRFNLSKKALNRVRIPLPPLEEQERIVGILDRFETLCGDLRKMLPAELEARQKQFAYYRERLLSFPEVSD